jgi:hypothetical protein
MTVEFPIDPPGIVSGYIGTVFDKIVGTQVLKFPPLFASSGPGSDRRKLRRFRQGEEPGAFFLGYRQHKPEQAQNVKDNEFVGGTVVGPSKGESPRLFAGLPDHLRTGFYAAGIKDITDFPVIFGFKEKLVTNENSRKLNKASPAAGPGRSEADFRGTSASDLPGANPTGDQPYREGPGFPMVKQKKDYGRSETVGEDSKKHRSHQGKYQFMPKGAAGEGKNSDDQDIHPHGPGNGKHPKGKAPRTGGIRLF